MGTYVLKLIRGGVVWVGLILHCIFSCDNLRVIRFGGISTGRDLCFTQDQHGNTLLGGGLIFKVNCLGRVGLPGNAYQSLDM